MIPRGLSELEETFAQQLNAEGIKFERQVKFCPGRKFSADFMIGDKLIVEINGGTWMAKSGHNSGSGISRDYEKANLAQILGYMYLQYTKRELDNLEALDAVKRLLCAAYERGE